VLPGGRRSEKELRDMVHPAALALPVFAAMRQAIQLFRENPHGVP
jgi:hypothetical protein